ncbi:hypothetical protein ABZ864_20515 [Streptomyces sp. NPDC047082]|uniref:hypothetical protein n=1 Tax=Streptomyces sp. NPDC047082 TaxID=3155259 RepID=UPI0033D37708
MGPVPLHRQQPALRGSAGADPRARALHGTPARFPVQPGILEETYVEGASRGHRLASDTIDSVRAGIAPRARLAVWPDLSSDIDAVLGAFPADGLVEGVRQDKDGRIHSIVADESGHPESADRISGVAAAALLSVYADERVLLFTAVVPDADGVVRARWRTEPTPADRSWAFRKTLRRGEIVGQEINARILDIDEVRERVALKALHEERTIP